MRSLNVLLSIGGASALLTSPALGQARPLPPQAPPARASMASAGPVRPPAQAAPPERGGGFNYYDSYSTPWRYTNGNVSVIMGADGRVYANFGIGYEQVARQCDAQSMVAGGYSAAASPPAYTQPEVTQPVPRAQTSSQAMIAQEQGNPGTATLSPGSAACWGRSSHGNLFVRR